MVSYEPPEPHFLNQDKEPRVNTTQLVAIITLASAFLFLCTWLLFVRARFLRSTKCVVCNEPVPKNGTERIGGYRCRIWHAACWADVERRLNRSPHPRNGASKSGCDGGSDVDKAASTFTRNKQARPRLSVLVGPRPKAGGSSSGFGSQDSIPLSLSSKIAPMKHVEDATNKRQTSVYSQTGSIGGSGTGSVETVPILKKDDPNYLGHQLTSPARSRPASAGSRNSITISLPASPRDAESHVPLPRATSPLRGAGGGGSPVKSRNSVIFADTASIHSVHSVHRPSPLWESMAGLPPVPALTLADGVSKRMSVPEPAVLKCAPWGAPSDLPANIGEVHSPVTPRNTFGLPVGLAFVPARSTSLSPQQQAVSANEPASTLAAIKDNGHQVRGSGGYFDQMAAHEHFELPNAVSSTPQHPSGGVIDFARPASVDWHQSVNYAVQQAGDNAALPMTQEQANVPRVNLSTQIQGQMQMPDPARYSLRPKRHDTLLAGAAPAVPVSNDQGRQAPWTGHAI